MTCLYRSDLDHALTGVPVPLTMSALGELRIPAGSTGPGWANGGDFIALACRLAPPGDSLGRKTITRLRVGHWIDGDYTIDYPLAGQDGAAVLSSLDGLFSVKLGSIPQSYIGAQHEPNHLYLLRAGR